jgi:hypothetical protein
VSPSPGRSLRRVRVGAAGTIGTAVAVLALSGCGVASDDGLRPGVAAQVGDTSIKLETVDDTAADLCEMIGDLAESGAASTVAGSVVRDNSLQYVVLRTLGDQLAAEYDVTPGDLYESSVARNESQLTGLGIDDGLLDAVVPTLSSGEYFLDVVQQIGREKLGLSSDEDTGQKGLAAGLQVARDWEAEHGLEVNPRFADISVGDVDEIVVTQLRDLSVPVSDFARKAVAPANPQNPDSSYADSLPTSQRCG